MKSNDVIGKRVAQVRLATAHEWSRSLHGNEKNAGGKVKTRPQFLSWIVVMCSCHRRTAS
jgi:hypothetical protein